MSTIKLHHPTGHPFWQRNKFKIEMSDGTYIDIFKFSKYNDTNGEEAEIYVEESGIYVQYFLCSSGCGKDPYGKKHLLIDKTEYSNIEYVGTPLIMSKHLINDIAEQGFK